MRLKANLFDSNAVNRTIKRIAHEIIEKNDSMDDVCLVGIKTRGIAVAERIAAEILKIENKKVIVGTIDISSYRDDLDTIGVKSSVFTDETLNFPIMGKNIILADDVIYTGRTVRAALDAILSNGRASKIQLAVLVDRGHRELPIRADYVGKNIPTSRSEIVKVKLSEYDEIDGIDLYEK